MTLNYNPAVTVEVTGCGGGGSDCAGSGGSGASDGGRRGDHDLEPFEVPFGGEFYLLILVAGYGIYTLSRKRQ